MEVLIASTFAGVTLFGMLYLFPKMKILVDTGYHRVAAIQACQTKMEAIINSGFSVIDAGTVQETVTLESGMNLVSTSDDLLGILTTTITNVQDGGGILIAKKILVRCQWVDHHAVLNEYVDLILYRNVP